MTVTVFYNIPFAPPASSSPSRMSPPLTSSIISYPCSPLSLTNRQYRILSTALRSPLATSEGRSRGRTPDDSRNSKASSVFLSRASDVSGLRS